MDDAGKPQNDATQQDEGWHELIELLNLLEAVDRRITSQHVAQRFRELLSSTAPSASKDDIDERPRGVPGGAAPSALADVNRQVIVDAGAAWLEESVNVATARQVPEQIAGADRPEPILRHATTSVPSLAAAVVDATPMGSAYPVPPALADDERRRRVEEVDNAIHSQEDDTQIRPPSGNPIPERCSSSGGLARGDSAYGRPGSRSELSALPASSQAWPKVSVVLPTLNEARNLPHVFAKLPAGLHEVIIVDGNSVDDTVATARRLRPDTRIIMQNRFGKGNALACGFAAATGDIIATVAADGSADPAEIPQFVRALLDGATFAKGTRFAKGGGSSDITRLRRIGSRMLSGLVNTLYRTRYSDLCYGYNAFWRHYVPVFGLDAETNVPAGGTRLRGDGFEVEALIDIRVAQAGLVVTEVASYEHSRIHGLSNLNAATDGWRILRTIVAERYYHHNRQKVQRKLAAELAAELAAGIPAHLQDTVIRESPGRGEGHDDCESRHGMILNP